MAEELRFPAGATLMNEGEAGDVAYVIKKGRVQIVKESAIGPQELAMLGPGQVVGEMALVDDKPRSATAVAMEPVVAKPIQRDRLLELLRTDADLALTLLQVLFERLRVSQNMIVDLRARLDDKKTQPSRLATPAPSAPYESEPASPPGRTQVSPKLMLAGKTDLARRVLPDGGLAISRLPFKIGRINSDPLSRNDLSIPDDEPFQVSRCHVAVYQDEDLMAITDRGSKDGYTVNGQRFGGEGNPNRIAYLKRGINRLTLGDENTQYVFDLMVE